jgi:hypothetical protein
MIEPRKAPMNKEIRDFAKLRKVKDFNKQRNKSNKNQKKYGSPTTRTS